MLYRVHHTIVKSQNKQLRDSVLYKYLRSRLNMQQNNNFGGENTSSFYFSRTLGVDENGWMSKQGKIILNNDRLTEDVEQQGHWDRGQLVRPEKVRTDLFLKTTQIYVSNLRFVQLWVCPNNLLVCPFVKPICQFKVYRI